MAQLQSTSITGTFKIGCTPDSGSTGNLWFDVNNNTLAIATALKSWSSVANMISTRTEQAGAAGDQSAALAINGGPFTPVCTEEFNGSTWATGGNLSVTRNYVSNGTTGTQNAALAVGGTPNLATEEYNGTSWSLGGNLPPTLGTSTIGIGGSQNSALAIACSTQVHTYNGTSWSAAASIPFAPAPHNALGAPAAGPSCSNIIASLADTPPTISCQVASFNGTTWTEEPSFVRFVAGNTSQLLRLGGCTSQATSYVWGSTEEYNGTSWSISANDIRQIGCDVDGDPPGAAGYAMIAFGGGPSPYGNSASEYGALSGTVKYIGK